MDCGPKLTSTASFESHSDRSVYLSALSTEVLTGANVHFRSGTRELHGMSDSGLLLWEMSTNTSHCFSLAHTYKRDLWWDGEIRSNNLAESKPVDNFLFADAP